MANGIIEINRESNQGGFFSMVGTQIIIGIILIITTNLSSAYVTLKISEERINVFEKKLSEIVPRKEIDSRLKAICDQHASDIKGMSENFGAHMNTLGVEIKHFKEYVDYLRMQKEVIADGYNRWNS